MSPRLALVRTLMATVALGVFVWAAATSTSPRLPVVVWALVALAAWQAVREGRRYWTLRRKP